LSDSTGRGDRPTNTLTAERTALAWTRTSFAFLANGALLMIKNLHGPVGPTAFIPAVLAAAVALGTYVIALRRQQILQQHPLPPRITPRRQVYTIGTAVLVLIIVTTFAQLI
jgi:uncharacterized membrane protein YidH (DUF202 family)